MVQNKDLVEEKGLNGIKDEVDLSVGITNGNHEPEEESEEEDDYLKYLTVVPSLDKSVEGRNMSLISQSLSQFYAAIEGRKEYHKIKKELMGSYVPRETKKVEQIQETIVNKLELNDEIKTELDVVEQINEVTTTSIEEGAIGTKNFSLQLLKARLVPEHEPAPMDQFFVCRRCKIFFKSRKFRKIHNFINHRRKKKDEVEVPTKPKRIRVPGKRKEPLVCDLCLKSFKIKALIRSHMNCHLSERIHQCSSCNYASKRHNDLKKHHDVHHDPNRVIQKRTRRRRCRECKEIFNDKKSLRTHMRLNHPKEKAVRKPRIFKKCEKCEEVLYSKKTFIIHMKEQHPEAVIIKCEICNRRFKTNFRLKKHKSRYELAGNDCRIKVRKFGEFACEHCNTNFPLKSHLSLHMRKHQTFTCEQCKQSFKTQSSLKYHEFSHLEIEPKCLNCEKIFTSETKFSNHLKRKACLHNGLTNGHAETITA